MKKKKLLSVCAFVLFSDWFDECLFPKLVAHMREKKNYLALNKTSVFHISYHLYSNTVVVIELIEMLCA